MSETQKQNEVQNLKENNKQNQLQSLQDIAKLFQSGKNNEEQKQKGIDYIIKLAQVESKYIEQKDNVKKDIKIFVEASLQNRLYKHVGEFNISKFDGDKDGNIDSKEEQDYANTIQEAITQIVLLGGLDNFSQIHYDSNSKDGFSNGDKWLASKIDLSKYLMGEKFGKGFAEELIQKSGNIKEEELHRIQENEFQATNSESWKELGILLAKEFGNGVEDVLRFITNIPSGVILLPRYLKYRAMTLDDNLNIENNTKIEYEIKRKELIEQNPSLGLLELLGEKGVEMIKKLGEMFTSGKQGDIATLMVTIAGLIAGGAGAAKLGLVMARKSAVNSAKIAGKETRIAGKTISKEMRELLKTRAAKVGKVAHVAGKIDDIVGGAGIGHLTGAYSGITVEKIKRAQEKSGVSYEVVLENAKLGDVSRLKKAEELVGELSQEQKDMILHIHNHISKGVYQNEFGDLRKMLEELGKVGFSREQSRILMENGILGDFPMNLNHILRKSGITIFDDDGFLQLSESEIAKISAQVPVLRQLVESGLYISKIDQLQYISSLGDEVIHGLLEGNKLKKILGLGIRVDTYVYEGTIKDLLKISKLSLQDVDNFFGNEFIMKLKNDGYNFSIDSIANTLPFAQEYLILKKWLEFSGDGYISYDSYIRQLRENGLTADGIDKVNMFLKNNNIKLNDFFSRYAVNFRLIQILSEVDESVLNNFFRQGGVQKLKINNLFIKDSEQLQNIAQYNDKKIDLLFKIRDSLYSPELSALHFKLEDYLYISENELEILLKMSVDEQKLIIPELIKIKSKTPEFIFHGEKNIQNLISSYKQYLASKLVHSVEVDLFQGNPEWKKFVDKMFRLGEYEDAGVIHVSTSQGIIAREWRGFFMNQTIGDCYLIAAMNAMRKNPHFVQELYQNLKYNKNENPLKSTYGYTFPDGEYIEVSLKDLKVEIQKGEKDPEVFLQKILENNGKSNELIYDILQKIERRGKVTDRGIIQLGDIELPYVDFTQYAIEMNGIKRIKFPDELLQEVKKQMKNEKGPYYDLAIIHIEKDRKMKSVDASLGYKVFEALYAKKYGKTKTGIDGGFTSSVMETFLSQNGWKHITNESFGKMGLKTQANKVYMENILNNFDSGNYIVTTSVNGIKGDGVSAYFSYGENDMASGHAYSVVGYDKTKKIVQVVNPWDNNHIIDIPLDDYFNIFDDVSIFEKVDIKQTNRVIPVEIIKKPKVYNLESVLQETGLNKIQFQQLFGMLGAKHQDIRFLDDGRVSIKLRDSMDTYYSIVFDPNLKTYKYISSEESPNIDFLSMQEYYARQIGCKSIDFRTQSLLGNQKSFHYLHQMFELGFKYKDNNINELLFTTFGEFLKTELLITIKIFHNLDDVIKSRDGKKIFLDFLKKLESKNDYTFFRYDMEKKIP